jgi:DNA/RNA-binding domain of Phe-tRNA-synthetase-like protein
MRFDIAPEVFELFPQFCRGIVVARDIDNSGVRPELEALLRRQQESLRGDAAVDIATHPRLAAWKQAYLKFGANPNKYTPSIVFLAKQVKAGKPVRSISPVVDAFNTISIKYLVPSGADDLDAVGGDLTLGRALSDETFAPIFKPEEVEHPEPGEVILVNRASKRVLCRRWNWRNADFSKISPESRNVAINVDGMMTVIDRSEIERAAEELRELILRFCGGSVSVRYLDAHNPETTL